MFTGIVSDVGQVRSIEAKGDTRFVFATGYDTGTITLGASIACSGACLTVIEIGADWFAAEASAETLGLTTLGDWREGTAVNFERALALGDELGGHLVSGHVDGVAKILSIEPEGDSSTLLSIRTGVIGDETEARARVVYDKIREVLGATG